ncbi:MAG: ROK family protein [Acidimicrobiia bacterium]
MSTLLDIGIELGGTKIVVAASTGGRDLTGRIRILTEEPQSTLAAVRSAIDDLAGSASVAGIGIGSFGPLDLRRESPAYGTIVRTPKPNWSGVDVVYGIVGDRDVPVAVDTDVAAALRAEHRWGAATTPTAAYATVGTGLGVALWSHGRIVEGLNHSEIGHIRVPRHAEDTFAGVCPYHGDCLEGMASGPAIGARWGAPAQSLSPATLAAALELEAWYLAHGIAGMGAVVPVETVVLGGGVAHMEGLHAAVADALPAASGDYPPIPFAEGGPAIVPPGLGDDAGVLGSIELARLARRAA